MQYVIVNNELYHHGIRGQRWGIRRYQNPDGTLTAAGKKHASSGDDKEKKKMSPETKKKVAIGVAVTAAAVGAAYIAKNPKAQEMTIKAASKAGYAVGKGTFNVGVKLTKSAGRVTDAMYDAALLSVGGIAIKKVSEKYGPKDSDEESTRNKKQVFVDATTAGIKTATKADKNVNNKTDGGKNNKVKLSEPPSNKGIDRSSVEYQNLFKDQDSETRSTIKSLASSGYDIDQIREYLEKK